MNTKSRKLLSALLALAIALGIFAAIPTTAGAADPVCEIGSTQYTDLDAALAAVPRNGPSQTVIKLVDNITYKTTCMIDNQRITFDLNGKNLVIEGGPLSLERSYVDYTGPGKFEVNLTLTVTGSNILSCALIVDKGSTCKLTGITITDNASGSNRFVDGVFCREDSVVIVDGDVSATGNGGSRSESCGVRTDYDGIVTVNGDITAAKNGIGVKVDNSATVTVNGTVTADAVYVKDELTSKTKEQHEAVSSKTGYLEYNFNDTRYVWVKAPSIDIAAQPANQSVTSGENATFSVVATGGVGALTYRWERSSNNGSTWSALIDITLASIGGDRSGFQGSKTASLTVRNAALSLNGNQFRCVVTDSAGASAISNVVTLSVKAAYVAVTGVTGVSTAAAAGSPLNLIGTVAPANATNQTIAWSVKNAGTTGAKISGNVLSATAEGSAVITATIANGATETTNFTADFTITVHPAGTPTITGPTSMILEVGYVATSSGVFTITGDPAPVVTKSSGNAGVTWNNTAKRLDIAAGLAEGTYPVALEAANGNLPNATITFRLTIEAEGFDDDGDYDGDYSGDYSGMDNFVKVNTYVHGFFTDVNENAWYGFDRQRSVANAYEYGLMRGIGATTFGPEESYTVAQAITVAARIHSIYTTGSGVFVEGAPWYKVYVDYAIANGMILANDFDNVSLPATRAEMAYILSRSLPADEFAERNTVKSLPDVNNGTPYYSSIMTLYKAGIVEGSDAAATYHPGSNITRAESSAIISRIILPATRISGKTYG